ncbi:MAG: aminotransferase class III-fold pyridoxal phosphate-dependent enzyme [Bacteroidetes bacterium]|nr:aminotransferase class III-fold pyridoxal phosphate-dependent enzyme [Bacteroidota bacterium]MBS1540295.1 aminotransferase class III-fold pyridoxal phosphate-dependent enzyme [Bacteroidota bacterium]
MTKSEELVARRNAIVPEGMGMFSPLTIVSGNGARITDADGKEYIDFAGGIGVLNGGHCPDVVVEAIIEQSKKLIHACFPVAIYEPYVKLCEELAALFPHGKNTKVMLLSTGAEAVENAVKIARQATGRQGIICFTGGFHGRTLLGMTLTSKVGYKIGCGPFAPEVYRIPFPDFYQRNDGLTMEAFINRELEAFESYLHNMVDASQVAAVILELVQGEGGFIVAPKRYVQELQKICHSKGILLIVDEVQTGFGRTGKWAAYQHYDIVPDISTWAKSMGSGMPIGAVIGRAEVMDKTTKGTLGGTYPGNPIACAASLATIALMKKIDVAKKGEQVGKTVKDYFDELKKDCAAIGEVRGLGAMVAFELVKNNDPRQPDTDLCKKLMQACAQNGLLIISAGVSSNVIRVLSPLVIEPADLMKGLKIIRTELLKLVTKN